MNRATRREFLAAAAASAGALTLGGCASIPQFEPRRAVATGAPATGDAPEIVVPTDRPLDLTIETVPMRLAGEPVRVIAINGSVPGPTLRMKEGQNVVINVHNRLKTEATSVHWHGMILPMDMDGVPGVSFPGIPPGETYTYRYPVLQSGTYWYHSHTGLQEQLGHYGALLVEPKEPEHFAYDREHVVMLNDWTYENPYRVLEKLKTFNGYYNYQRQTLANLPQDARANGLLSAIGDRLRWQGMRMDPTDIADITGATYTYLMNGRSATENWTALAEPGQRVRLRLINAATMTYFDFRIPGLTMTVVAADGQPVKPVEVAELRIAVAETYDVIVTPPDDRAYTMFAETMDRSGFTRGTLAPRPGMTAPVPAQRPRPLRTMADMGMAAMGSMDAKSPNAGKGAAGTDGMKGMAGMAGGEDAQPMAGMAERSESLPTESLPKSVMHAPEGHGKWSVNTAMMPTRRYDEPGIGLGDDGWRVLTYGDLRALRRPADRRAPDREFELHLTGNMERYVWGFDGKTWSEAGGPIEFVHGERVRINLINDTMMEHPLHLHGMWTDLYAGGTLEDNPRKHTVSVKPGELMSVDITADAPGRWAFHCHLLYHMDAGMFRTVAVVRSLGATRKDRNA